MQSREEEKISGKRSRVPHGATILPLLRTSICDNLLSKNNLKNSGHDKVVDRILCVWFCGPKKSRFFGSQSCSIRDGLTWKKYKQNKTTTIGKSVAYGCKRETSARTVKYENKCSLLEHRTQTEYNRAAVHGSRPNQTEQH